MGKLTLRLLAKATRLMRYHKVWRKSIWGYKQPLRAQLFIRGLFPVRLIVKKHGWAELRLSVWGATFVFEPSSDGFSTVKQHNYLSLPAGLYSPQAKPQLFGLPLTQTLKTNSKVMDHLRAEGGKTDRTDLQIWWGSQPTLWTLHRQRKDVKMHIKRCELSRKAEIISTWTSAIGIYCLLCLEIAFLYSAWLMLNYSCPVF